MNYYFLTHKNMGKKANALTAIAAAAAIATSPVSADTNNQAEPHKIEQKEAAKKVEQITCSTKLACERLSNSIQAQIDELEVKGDLTKDEKRLRYNLRKKLIAVENDKQAQENKKQAQQKIVIAQKDTVIKQEKAETAQEKAETQAKYAELLGELRSIKGSL